MVGCCFGLFSASCLPLSPPPCLFFVFLDSKPIFFKKNNLLLSKSDVDLTVMAVSDVEGGQSTVIAVGEGWKGDNSLVS